jgi:hypothetical protein
VVCQEVFEKNLQLFFKQKPSTEFTVPPVGAIGYCVLVTSASPLDIYIIPQREGKVNPFCEKILHKFTPREPHFLCKLPGPRPGEGGQV